MQTLGQVNVENNFSTIKGESVKRLSDCRAILDKVVRKSLFAQVASVLILNAEKTISHVKKLPGREK